jgi:LmbE family N-acetylglucosaminyl deacetylase
MKGTPLLRSTLLFCSVCLLLPAQNNQLRVIAFGAHPDDCDIRASGTAALFVSMGHKVKFVSVTNGDAGHHEMHGPALAARRLKEAKESAKRLGTEYDVLDNHDGELLPTLLVRQQVIREIRSWNADIVLAPRPNDYHPDHRYTGVLVQDAAYMVVVPSVVPDVPPLRKNPVFLYYEDRFQRPNPFRPDIAVRLDDVIDKKVAALDAHVSQFYEWLPWVDGRLNEVPKGTAERKEWLKKERSRPPNEQVRAALIKWYGPETAAKTEYYEAFEICEYGAQPNTERIRQLFPMLRAPE